MKITILIEDATEEEARRLLQAPKQDGNTLRIDTCGIKWSDEEKDAIKPAKDWYEAVALYKTAFPESHRNRDGIRKKFWEMHRKKPDAAPAEIPPAPIAKKLKEKFNPPTNEKKSKSAKTKAALAKNFDAARWTDEERRPILDADSREEAIASYREKYPESERSDDAIGRQFYELCPDKRSPETIWTDEEKRPILDAESVEDAIADYQKNFPLSERTIPAIKREWYELRPEKRGEIPTGRKKGGTNKAPLKGTAREKYEIPFSTKQNAKAYNHAVYICTKYDKPYAEAVKLEEADLKKKKQKKANEVVEVPKKIRTTKPKLPYKMRNKQPEDLQKTPADEQSTPQDPPVDPPRESEKDFRVTDRVQQIAGFPAYHGVGIVKRVIPGKAEVLVGFDNGQSWILRKNLQRSIGGETA